jgi:glycine betaine/proline transport system ATP-binding protein
MEVYDPVAQMSGITISKDAIIETLAETVLSEQKPVAVTDAEGKIVGVLNSKTIIRILFGEAKRAPITN